MKKSVRYTLPIIVLAMVVLFCVSSTAAVINTQTVSGHSYSEPINVMLLGLGLLGVGTFMKNRLLR